MKVNYVRAVVPLHTRSRYTLADQSFAKMFEIAESLVAFRRAARREITLPDNTLSRLRRKRSSFGNELTRLARGGFPRYRHGSGRSRLSDPPDVIMYL